VAPPGDRAHLRCTGCEPRSKQPKAVLEGDLQAVSEAGNEDMCLDALIGLMIDRSGSVLDVDIVYLS
jgi:hypothetical protein